MKRLSLVILMLFLSYNVSFAKDKYVGKGQAQFDDKVDKSKFYLKNMKKFLLH